MNILQNRELEKHKENAHSSLGNLTFPTKKEEDWKYTRISEINPEHYAPAKQNPVSQQIVDENSLEGLDSFKIVFVDGVFSEKFSNYPKEKLIVLPFSEAVKEEKYHRILSSKFDSIVDKEQYFTLLNTVSTKEGTFIYVPKNTAEEKPVELIYINTPQEQKASQTIRNLFIVEDNSQILVTERIHTLSDFGFLTNAVTEIFIGKNSHFRLYKIQDDVPTACLVDATFVEQDQDSQAFVHTFAFGGKVIRNELSFDHKGENINSTLKGITIIEGEQEVGNHTLVRHNQPNCESHELYRGIYNDKAHGIFNGKIKVHKIAQKTNAFQQNNTILLSDKAEIDTKPQLEIFADDVKCSHGCTVGQLDTDALFYMKQRGIHEKEAKALLMFAFCADVMETVTLPELKNKINKIIARKLDVNIDFDF
ncbi:MAG: Fe-S cluster assembly protein SufD [Flavobacteriaceae bacterium]|jgi:Fe-S cluster assembly protein SufD|nr:Fe-S cluster assembly protein SufD [Flavobacteriaceae bacterium]